MTDDQRPDPDQLLNHIQEEEARAQRGKLKILAQYGFQSVCQAAAGGVSL